MIEKVIQGKRDLLSIGISTKDNARPSSHSGGCVVGPIYAELVPCKGMQDDLLEARTLGREFRMPRPPTAEPSNVVVFGGTLRKIEKRWLAS